MTGGSAPPAILGPALAAAWLVLAAAAWAVLGLDALAALGALGPAIALWLAVALRRRASAAEEDRARNRAEIDGLRQELRRLARPRPSEEAPAQAQAPPREPGPEEEPPPRPRPSQLPPEEFVRALNFPEDADDAEGFEALRRALADPQARKLVQASQDVLTLLSQNGVFMDDIEIAPAGPAVWRRFAGGVRGEAVAEIAGVDDEDALELARARMARDTIFRDAAQHFLRQFDLGLQRFVADASDEHLALFGQTRTAIAYMLLARAAKLLD